MELSICCVTKAAEYAKPFIEEIFELAQYLDAEVVLGLHGADALSYVESLSEQYPLRSMTVSGRFIEEMLNPVLELCSGKYILRLDDDERAPETMREWLKSGAYTARDSWFFPRFHVWPDRDHVITTQPFFPDFQGRLTTREKSFRPPTLHAGQPHPAHRAPVHFEHHAFLVKNKEERRAIAAHYESLLIGKPFPSEMVDVVFPEDAPKNVLRTEPIDPEPLMARANRFPWWRQAGMPLPPDLEQQMVDWTKAEKVIRPRLG